MSQAQAVYESRQERGQMEPPNHVTQYSDVTVKQEYDVTKMQCSKCSTTFRDEGLLRGHEEVCNGPTAEQGRTTMYAKGKLWGT